MQNLKKKKTLLATLFKSPLTMFPHVNKATKSSRQKFASIASPCEEAGRQRKLVSAVPGQQVGGGAPCNKCKIPCLPTRPALYGYTVQKEGGVLFNFHFVSKS